MIRVSASPTIGQWGMSQKIRAYGPVGSGYDNFSPMEYLDIGSSYLEGSICPFFLPKNMWQVRVYYMHLFTCRGLNSDGVVHRSKEKILH